MQRKKTSKNMYLRKKIQKLKGKIVTVTRHSSLSYALQILHLLLIF